MIQLGEFQRLQIVKQVDFGYYLKEVGNSEQDSILLPLKEADQAYEQGDFVNVFVYKDSQDRLICTTITPKLMLNQLAMLEVTEVNKIGAFLDWGLAKELLLPYREQLGEVVKGKKYLVTLYIDKSKRLCATMKVGNYLTEYDVGYDLFAKGDQCQATVYNIHKELGLFVAVNDRYKGLIPAKEMIRKYRVGDQIEAYIAQVKSDGRLDLSFKVGGFSQMEADEKILYDALVKNRGFLPVTDSTDKKIINSELGISKRAFKRSLGRLMKAGKVEKVKNGIQLIDADSKK